MSAPEPAPDIRPDFSPLHGFQGSRAIVPSKPLIPAGLTIALSREAGARGASIAKRVGRKTGWQVYNQELLDYIAQERSFGDTIANLPPAAMEWAKHRLAEVFPGDRDKQPTSIVDMARTVLFLASQGEVVLLGRGAGVILPRESTLNVRIVAPRNDRIAYMAQRLRQTNEEASDTVKKKDEARDEFIQAHFNRKLADVYQYDLLLNSSSLGEDMCVELIVQAAKAKQLARTGGA